jgi:putative Holliday junction resolvase
MRALGIDLGSKTMGLAITDSLRIVVSGLENYEFPDQDLNYCLEKIRTVFKQYRNDIDTIVLGYPLRLNDQKNENTFRCEEFSRMLKADNPNVKVILHDERFSTVKATDYLKYDLGLKASKIKKVKDKMSAVIILQD